MTSDGRELDPFGKFDDDKLLQLKKVIESESDLIVEHRHYFGGRGSTRLIFSDADLFEEYVRTNVRPGDILNFWLFERCCNDQNLADTGILPDAAGNVPRDGCY